MATFETAKKKFLWFDVPYGTWIILDYDEARNLTSDVSKEVISRALSAIGSIYATAAAIAIRAQQGYIHDLNEKSDHKGVKLLFVWATGMILSVERRGFSAPAPGPGPGPAPRPIPEPRPTPGHQIP